MCLWDFEASMCATAWKINWGFTWNTDRGNSWKGEVCFLNGYFQLSLRDFVIAIVSRETWWVGGWVVGDSFGVCLPSPTSCCEDWWSLFSCWENPSTPIGGRSERIYDLACLSVLTKLVTLNKLPCFTWNHLSSTTKIYWIPRNNIRFPNLAPSCLLSANQGSLFNVPKHD